jgi:hypothetical protein
MALSVRQKQHIKAWQNSGLTKSTYCHQHELNLKTFGRWFRLARQAGEVREPQLIPVRMQSEPTTSRALLLRLPQGRILEMPASVSSHWLGALLQCLI